MTDTRTVINAIVDAVITDLKTATTIGLTNPATSTALVYERDEHPVAAMNRGDLPCAYVIPIMEGGDIISTDIDKPLHHEFPITVTAYYLGSDQTAIALDSDLRRVRNYAYNFLDYYKNTRSGGLILGCATKLGSGAIRGFKIDVGYWITGGGQVIHFWIMKMNIVTYTL